MNFMKLFLSILISSFLLIENNPPSFPKFESIASNGKKVSSENLKGKKTIFAVYYLGYFAAMNFQNDLEQMQKTMDTSKYQIICLLLNTESQIKQFNEDEKNLWSNLRFFYKLEKSNLTQIPDCTVEKRQVKKGDIGPQCENLAKKLNYKSSPTIYYLDENAEIVKIEDGFITSRTQEERIKMYYQNFEKENNTK